jgi:hypothetical protein
MFEVKLVLCVAGAFVAAIAVARHRVRRAFADPNTPLTVIDAPIALDIARYHRKLWALIAGLGMLAFMLVASIDLGATWSAVTIAFALAAGATCVRFDYMLCAIDHPDVRLSTMKGFVIGSIGNTLVGWLSASPALVQKIAGTYLPSARMRQ